MFIETIQLTLRAAPVILPLPTPNPPQKLQLHYYNGINAGQSVSFNLPAGQVKRITAKWTDYAEGTKVDFYLAGQLVGRDVDVNSDGKGRVMDLNRNFPASTLTLVVKNDPIY